MLSDVRLQGLGSHVLSFQGFGAEAWPWVSDRLVHSDEAVPLALQGAAELFVSSCRTTAA